MAAAPECGDVEVRARETGARAPGHRQRAAILELAISFIPFSTLSFRSVCRQTRLALVLIAGPGIEWQYRNNITGSIKQFSFAKMAPDCCFVRIRSGRKMTDQIGRSERGSFSSIEILSVAAI